MVKLMAFQGKRKRSEKIKPEHDTRRLRLLGLLYALFLIPCVLNPGILLAVMLVIVLVFGILAMDSAFLLRDRNSSSSLLLSLTTTAITVFAWFLLTAAAWTGLVLWAGLLAFGDSAITSALILMTIIPSVCIPLTYELQLHMIEWLSQIQRYFAERKQQHTVAAQPIEHELEAEADIPLELLAEAESAEQARR
jgi:hypothetical protein